MLSSFYASMNTKLTGDPWLAQGCKISKTTELSLEFKIDFRVHTLQLAASETPMELCHQMITSSLVCLIL